MKRIICAALAVIALAGAAHAAPSMGARKQPPQLDVQITPQPPSGTLCITFDDGLRPVQGRFLDSLKAVNERYDLIGTPGEMHVSLFANMHGENGLLDFPPTSGTSGAMTISELRRLASSGYVEVGLHGMWADLSDPDAPQSPRKATGLFWNGNHTEIDSTVYDIVVGGAKAMRDTLGIEFGSYVNNGHRMTPQMAWMFYLAGIKQARAGSIQTPTLSTNWPDAATGGASSAAIKLGKVRELNRQNLSLTNFWYCGYAGHYMEAYLMFDPVDRYWIPHLNPPTAAGAGTSGQPAVGASGVGGASARVDTTKAIIADLAMNKKFGVLVWHDIWDAATSADQYIGWDGIGEVLDFAAQYCVNTKDNALGPRLQVLSFSEGVSKKVDWKKTYSGQTFPLRGNPKLEADYRNPSIPWGWPEGLLTLWTANGWVYFDSTAAAGNSLFGYHGETGGWANTSSAAGANPLPFHDVFSVPPGARITFSITATIDSIPSSARSGPSFPDSISTAKFNAQVWYLRQTSDPSDTTNVWVTTPATGAGTEANVSGGFTSWRGAGDGPGSTYWTTGASTVARWNQQKIIGGFHWQDQWRVARAKTSTDADNWWFQNDDPDGSGVGPDERAMRHRTFYFHDTVPEDCSVAIVKWTPVGMALAAAVSDTLIISSSEAFVTIQ